MRDQPPRSLLHPKASMAKIITTIITGLVFISIIREVIKIVVPH
jgi:hypothetical protein